ncbi:MAG TPA: sugar phosphate isomerase/epimerase [Bryobacteraceae bacterium]|jgi:sugar phosphate isomerase/epimerase|nr:sugar phosphate isomerase/epimerase [Bryobacteraceae bacterium]
MKLRLGIVADEISRDFREAVRIGKRLGLARYEVRNLTSGRAPMCDPSEIVAAEETAEREEVRITALSPGLFKYTEDAAAFAREMAETYPRAVELAHRWDLPGLIVFGFHKPGATESNASSIPSDNPPPEIIDWLEAAGERAAADGLELMIEPEPICWADTGRAAAKLIRRAGVKSVRINYDPGNVAWLENRDPLGEFESVAPWIANVHIKDLRPLTQGAGKPEWVPPGQGMIDYRAHFRALRRIGYEGPVSLEPHMDGSEETTRACKDAVERLWQE